MARDNTRCPSLFLDGQVTERQYKNELLDLVEVWQTPAGEVRTKEGGIEDAGLACSAILPEGFPDKPLRDEDVAAAIKRVFALDETNEEWSEARGGAALGALDTPKAQDLAEASGFSYDAFRSYIRKPGAKGRREMSVSVFSKLVDGCAKLSFSANASCDITETRRMVAYRLLGIDSFEDRRKKRASQKRKEADDVYCCCLAAIVARAATLDVDTLTAFESIARLFMFGSRAVHDGGLDGSVGTSFDLKDYESQIEEAKNERNMARLMELATEALSVRPK